MKLSIVPLFVLLVFAFCIFITHRARRDEAMSEIETRSVYIFIGGLFLWTVAAAFLGLRGIHSSPELLDRVPFLWQAFVAVAMWMAMYIFSSTLRGALNGLADSTPATWLVFVQALRIGALGSIMKATRGEITSDYPLWVGIPDFLFGASAIVVGLLELRKPGSYRKTLVAWSITGAAIILLPTFGLMPYWMNEPGFTFIFEFPMVMAPSIIVPIFILLNFLLAWKAMRQGVNGRAHS